MKLLDDVRRLDELILSLQRHFGQAEKDLEQIATSTKKITRRAEQIEEVQLADAKDEAPDAPAVATEGHAATVVNLSKHGT